MSEVEETEIGFNSRERGWLDTLHQRLDWLRDQTQHPEGGYTEENGFFKGEASAIAWALDYIEAGGDPLVLRMSRQERLLRKFGTRLGRVEHDLYADDEEEVTP